MLDYLILTTDLFCLMLLPHRADTDANPGEVLRLHRAHHTLHSLVSTTAPPHYHFYGAERQVEVVVDNEQTFHGFGRLDKRANGLTREIHHRLGQNKGCLLASAFPLCHERGTRFFESESATALLPRKKL